MAIELAYSCFVDLNLQGWELFQHRITFLVPSQYIFITLTKILPGKFVPWQTTRRTCLSSLEKNVLIYPGRKCNIILFVHKTIVTIVLE